MGSKGPTPAAEAQRELSEDLRWVVGVQHPLRILLVEDEVTLRQVIVRNLAGRGHTVHEVATASEGIEAALVLRPDLLLLDINLPDRTGWDVLRELRRRNVEIPTVVISAVRVGPARLAEFRPLAYLPKPFPLDALLQVVTGVAEEKKPVKT